MIEHLIHTFNLKQKCSVQFFPLKFFNQNNDLYQNTDAAKLISINNLDL